MIKKYINFNESKTNMKLYEADDDDYYDGDNDYYDGDDEGPYPDEESGEYDEDGNYIGGGGGPGYMTQPYYGGGYGQTKISEFKEGDDVIYIKDKSSKDGKAGKYLRTREDGKYSLVFDNGVKFAADPKYVFSYTRMKKN